MDPVIGAAMALVIGAAMAPVIGAAMAPVIGVVTREVGAIPAITAILTM